ncbi:MAG: hypothetical protein ACMUIU_19270 [bacterium]
MIRTLKQKIKKKIGFLCCILFILFVFACGGDIENQVPSSGSGSVAFSVEWTGLSNSRNNYSSLVREKPDPIDCLSAGIVYIKADVYDANDNYLVSGGPWDCSEHGGIIDNIPSGLNRKIVILAYDSNGNIKYRGEVTGITIRCDETTDVGVIPAFFIDYSGTWSLTERVIESVGEYPDEIGKENTYLVQLELMEDGNASLTILSHSQKFGMSGKILSGEFKDNQLTVYSDDISFLCGPVYSEDFCFNGQLTIDLTFSLNDTAYGTMTGDSCCSDGGYTIWSINVERPRPIYLIDYYPLKTGNQWFYQGYDDGKKIEWLEYMSNIVNINGNSAMKIEEVGRSNDSDYSWIDPNTGFWKFGWDEADQEIRFDPPIIWPSILEIGKIYQKSTNLLRDGVNVGTKTDTIKIEGMERVFTPAGTFDDCLIISINSEYYYDPNYYDPNSPSDNDNYIVWWAKGIGEVQRDDVEDVIFGELVWAIVDGKIYRETTISMEYSFIDYYPLNIENQWYYQGFYDGEPAEWLEYVLTQVTINENPAMRIEELGRWNGQDYSWIDPNVFMHFGWDEEGSEIRYDPPIYLPGLLIIGGFYQGSSNLFRDGNQIGTNTYTITVEDVENVSTPAGVFDDCLKILFVNSHYFYDLNSSDYIDVFRKWFARGIGEVKDIDIEDGRTGELLWANVDGTTHGTTTDLTGKYWYVGFLNEKTGESGINQCSLGASSFYDDGTYSYTGIFSEENTGPNQRDIGTKNYKVTQEGTIFIDDSFDYILGKIQEGEKLLILSNVNDLTGCNIYVLAQKPLIENLNVSSLQGEYWHVGYAFDPNSGHKCKLSTYSFFGNGYYNVSQKFSEEGTGANQDYTNYEQTYTVDPNGTVHFLGDGLTGMIQEGGNLILASDVTKPDSWRIDIFTKKSLSGNFSNASLNGDYWRVDFSYNSDYGHRCALGVMTFEGNGNHSVLQKYSEENTGANLPYRETGTHDIESDGTVFFDNGLIGKIQEGGDLIIATDINRTDEWRITIIFKKPIIQQF